MRRRVVASVGLAMVALTGCSAANSMQAATSQEFQVSQSQVDAEVRQLLTDLGQAPGDAPEGLALATTQRLVQDALITAAADELQVAVTPAQVEAAIAEAGGMEAVQERVLQSYVPKSSTSTWVRSSLLFTRIGDLLDSGGTADSKSAAAVQELIAFSERIDLEVAPRYGTWNDASLQIVPGSAVASPAAEQPATP